MAKASRFANVSKEHLCRVLFIGHTAKSLPLFTRHSAKKKEPGHVHVKYMANKKITWSILDQRKSQYILIMLYTYPASIVPG